jgi:hypothetical protein
VGDWRARDGVENAAELLERGFSLGRASAIELEHAPMVSTKASASRVHRRRAASAITHTAIARCTSSGIILGSIPSRAPVLGSRTIRRRAAMRDRR